MLIWHVEDEKFEYDGQLTVKDLILFKKNSNLGLREIDEALSKGDIHALMCLTYILMRRAGKAVQWDDMMNLKAQTLWMENRESEAIAEEDGGAPEKKEAKAGPTRSATGTNRKPAATST